MKGRAALAEFATKVELDWLAGLGGFRVSEVCSRHALR
jgi:hypothetical protein